VRVEAQTVAPGPGYIWTPGYWRWNGATCVWVSGAWVRQRLQTDEDHLTLCAIGHSLGAAVALDFATHHRVRNVVLIAPFTTLREEAAMFFGGWIARMLIESYDNRANLSEVYKGNPDARVAIFHGTNDEVIPVRMGRELVHAFPSIEFFAVENADHVSVLNHAHDDIINWMTGASGTSGTDGSEPNRH